MCLSSSMCLSYERKRKEGASSMLNLIVCFYFTTTPLRYSSVVVKNQRVYAIGKRYTPESTKAESRESPEGIYNVNRRIPPPPHCIPVNQE